MSKSAIFLTNILGNIFVLPNFTLCRKKLNYLQNNKYIYF